MNHFRKTLLVLTVLCSLFTAVSAFAEGSTAKAELLAGFRQGSGTICNEAQDPDAPLPEKDGPAVCPERRSGWL